jgi:hypothetical protein
MQKNFQSQMNADKSNTACAATADFGLRREAKRHAAFGVILSHEKRCRRFALPAQSKSCRQMPRDFRVGCF